MKLWNVSNDIAVATDHADKRMQPLPLTTVELWLSFYAARDLLQMLRMSSDLQTLLTRDQELTRDQMIKALEFALGEGNHG